MKKKLLLSAAVATTMADAETRVRLGRRSKWLIKNYRQHYNSYVKPFFCDCPVTDITSSKLRAFESHLAEKGLKASSILPVMSFVSVVLKMAYDDGHIDKMPRIPRQGQKPSPRPAFTRLQYIALRQTARRLARTNPPEMVRGHPITAELNNAITFIVNSFMRPGDIINLQHKHVAKVQSEDGDWFLRLSLPSSKGHTAPIVTMPVAVPIYRRQSKLHAQQYGGPEDYVFFPGLSRPFARELFRRQFTVLLKKANVTATADGQSHTLYSLRHSAIVFRLLNSKDLDLLTLARACRTSVDMIDRYYASSLTAEMNVDKLHSFKRQTRYVQGKAGGVREVEA